MPPALPPLAPPLPTGAAGGLAPAEVLLADLQARWRGGQPVAVEEYLRQLPALSQQPGVLLELIRTEWQLRQEQGPPPSAQEYSSRFPSVAQELERLLLAHAFGDSVPTPEATLASVAADPYATRSQPATVRPGDSLRYGKYRLIQPFGRGGMGDVYLAEDERLQRRVALKMMRPEYAAQPEYRSRFLREARLAASLEHDHVVPIFEVGEEEETLFLVMPLLRGQSLEDRLRAQPALPLHEVLRIGREIAQGLAAAHARGLVHRDIKSANIWLESAGEPGASATEGRVKTLDFGLARPTTGGEGLTEAGSFLGTPGYAAPEQINGLPLDGRADLFSLGVVLYRMVAGVLPFRGEGVMGMIRAALEQAPVPPHQANPAVPPPLSNLILALLAKEPARRPGSAQAVVAALRDLEADGAVTKPPAFLPQPPAPELAPDPLPVGTPSRRRRKWAVLGVVGLSLVALISLVALSSLVLSWLRPAREQGSLRQLLRTDRPPLPAGGGGEQVKIIKLDVEHFAGESGDLHGQLGSDSYVTFRDDRLTLAARLSRPAHAFLIAFDPAGGEQLLFPDDENAAPPETDRPRYPSTPAERAARYTLNDGVGLQVFAVVVLREPLSYRQWKARRGESPWKKHTARPDVVWWDDGTEIWRWAAGDNSRGKGQEEPGASEIKQLTDWLRQDQGEVEAAAALGFAVLPKDKR